MAIELASSFNRNSGVPLDSREVVVDIAARDAIPALVRYIGMKVTVLDDGAGEQMTYELAGGTGNDKWREYGSGGSGSGILTVADQTERNAIASGDRYDGLIVYVLADQMNYQLQGGIANTNWKAIPIQVVADDTARDALPAMIGRQVYNDSKKRVQIQMHTNNSSWFNQVVHRSAVINNLTSGGTIDLVQYANRQTFFVEGTSGPVTLDAIPFFAPGVTRQDDLEVTLIGTSNSKPVTIPASNAASGVAGYDVTIGLGQSVTYGYSEALGMHFIKSVSN
nr:hypothetical protein BdHM001_18370 [Bdellovibrio sp. HM001]